MFGYCPATSQKSMQIGNHFVLEKTVTAYRQFFSSLIIDEVIFGM